MLEKLNQILAFLASAYASIASFAVSLLDFKEFAFCQKLRGACHVFESFLVANTLWYCLILAIIALFALIATAAGNSYYKWRRWTDFLQKVIPGIFLGGLTFGLYRLQIFSINAYSAAPFWVMFIFLVVLIPIICYGYSCFISSARIKEWDSAWTSTIWFILLFPFANFLLNLLVFQTGFNGIFERFVYNSLGGFLGAKVIAKIGLLVLPSALLIFSLIALIAAISSLKWKNILWGMLGIALSPIFFIVVFLLEGLAFFSGLAIGWTILAVIVTIIIFFIGMSVCSSGGSGIENPIGEFVEQVQEAVEPFYWTGR